MTIRTAITIITIGVSALVSKTYAQWSDHLSYGQCTMSAAVGNIAVAANTAGILYYDPSESYIGKISKTNYLSAIDITTIAADGDRLLIGYDGGDIDILDMTEMSLTNIPELRMTSNVSLKTINSIVRSGNRYYCAFASGILELDRSKYEIKSTWKNIGGSATNVNDVCVAGGYIYAATASGIYKANLSSNTLEDPSQWELMGQPSSNVKKLAAIDDVVFAAEGESSSDTAAIWRIAEGDTAVVLSIQKFRSMSSEEDQVIIAESTSLSVYDSNLTKSSSLTSAQNASGTNILSNVRDAHFLSDGRLAIADYSNGLLIASLSGSATSYTVQGPYNNTMTDILATDDYLYCTGAGRNGSYNNLYNPVILSVYNSGKWTNTASYSGRDACLLTADPNDESQVYLSTWGTGIFKVENQTLSTHYTTGNSTLTDIFGGSGYVRTDAMAYDDDHNLYVIEPNNTTGIHIMTQEGEWYYYTYGNFPNWHSSIGMIVTSNGNAWAWSSSKSGKYMIFNTNGTPETGEDDLYMGTCYNSSDDQFVGTFSLTDESSGDNMGDLITCAVEDKDGLLWVGTSYGLLTCADDKYAFVNNTVTFNRIKVPRNDGTNLADYLLDEMSISCIAVDGANRKWIGTSDNGVYFISSDGLETIYHFTSSDSPLLSDDIKKIAVSPDDGEVFILTSAGLQSYKGDATEPVNSLNDVNVFPNPASISKSNGYVNITGLESNSHVFITDLAGNRVFYMKSNGGMVCWNMRRNGGARVAPGIYIIWASNTDGSNKTVGKVLVNE